MRDFDKLVQIRRRRSDRAQTDERHARNRLIESQKDLAESRQAAEDYRVETMHLEQELLAKVLNRSVTLNDLLDVEVQLKKAEKHAQELVDRITVCKNAEEESINRVNEAHAQRITQVRRLNKSEEVEKHFLQSANDEVLRQDDALMDEFCGIAFCLKGTQT